MQSVLTGEFGRMNDKVEIPEAQGPTHYFWLFREGERTYEEYRDLLQRRDATVCLQDDVIQYILGTLRWVPTSNGHGLNPYGPNVFNRAGGEAFQKVCQGWAQILSQGPETLLLSTGWMRVLDEEGKESDGKPYRFRISRAELVQKLDKLAECAGLIASGDYFLFHLGP